MFSIRRLILRDDAPAREIQGFTGTCEDQSANTLTKAGFRNVLCTRCEVILDRKLVDDCCSVDHFHHSGDIAHVSLYVLNPGLHRTRCLTAHYLDSSDFAAKLVN